MQAAVAVLVQVREQPQVQVALAAAEEQVFLRQELLAVQIQVVAEVVAHIQVRSLAVGKAVPA